MLSKLFTKVKFSQMVYNQFFIKNNYGICFSNTTDYSLFIAIFERKDTSNNCDFGQT